MKDDDSNYSSEDGNEDSIDGTEENEEFAYDNLIQSLKNNISNSTDIVNDEEDTLVNFKQAFAKEIVNDLIALKSIPEKERPYNYAEDYNKICSYYNKGKDTYVHQELLNRMYDAYLQDDLSLKDTSFYLELFSNITDAEKEASIIHRHPKRAELLSIKTAVANLRQPNTHTDSQDINVDKKPSVHKSSAKVSPEVYLEDAFNIYDRLDSTVSEFSKIRKHDSPEFVNLMKTAKKLSELRDKSRIDNNKVTHKQLDGEPDKLMSTLYEQTKLYITHCKQDPKIGSSRREKRFKNAQRLLLVCESYQKKVTVKDVLQDKIAESILLGLTNTKKASLMDKGKTKEAAALDNNCKKEDWRKGEVEYNIKPHPAFKTLISGAHDTFDLYHMLEKPTRAYSKFCKIFKDAEKKKNTAPKSASKTLNQKSSIDNILTK